MRKKVYVVELSDDERQGLAVLIHGRYDPRPDGQSRPDPPARR